MDSIILDMMPKIQNVDVG